MYCSCLLGSKIADPIKRNNLIHPIEELDQAWWSGWSHAANGKGCFAWDEDGMPAVFTPALRLPSLVIVLSLETKADASLFPAFISGEGGVDVAQYKFSFSR